MEYSVLQKTLEKPSVEQLRRAFRSLMTLTDNDAATLARDAYGSLVDGLSWEDAHTLQRALAREGVESEVVEQGALPSLPPAKRIKRFDCLEEHLVHYDALGRPSRVPWTDVTLVAAGMVNQTEFQRVETERVVYRGGPRGGAMPIVLTDVSHKETRNLRMTLEVHLIAEPHRCRAFGDEFQYGYLGDRLQRGAAANFALLVRDLVTKSGAVANLGAQAITDDSQRTFQYPSRHAFEEEIAWLLWRSQSAAS